MRTDGGVSYNFFGVHPIYGYTATWSVAKQTSLRNGLSFPELRLAPIEQQGPPKRPALWD